MWAKLYFTGKVTWVCQKFCKILTWSTVRQFWILLTRFWMWQTVLNCEMWNSLKWSSPSNTHRICLYGFEYCFKINASRSTWPMPDHWGYCNRSEFFLNIFNCTKIKCAFVTWWVHRGKLLTRKGRIDDVDLGRKKLNTL